jgi:hypothetical protein
MGKPTAADIPAELRYPPSSFTISLESIAGQAVRWRGPVILTHPSGTQELVQCETGYSMREDSVERQTALRAEVWRILKAGEIGRSDLIAYARIDRHAGPNRKVSAPGITIKPAES